MATTTLRAHSALSNLVPIAAILGRFDRPTLETFLTVAVELLDVADGDPDFENATDLEDDFALSPQALGYGGGPGCAVSDCDHGNDEGEPNFISCRDVDGGAGCPIADPGGCQHDGREADDGY
jgi:hypothetical protein